MDSAGKKREEMDELSYRFREGVSLYMERNKRSDEGLQMDSAGKMPAVQGGPSEEEMGMRGKMPINLRSDEKRLQFHAEGKGQGEDSEEEMEMPSNQGSDELDAAGKKPEIEDEVDAVAGFLRESMRPSHQQHEILNHDEEHQRQKQENQRQKQEDQIQKQKMSVSKKHHCRKSRMAVRRIIITDKMKKSNMEEPPMVDKAAGYLALWAKEDESEPESESDWNAYMARVRRDSWNESFASSGHYGTYETATDIPSMRFTDCVDEDDDAGPRETLQIFSVKVVETKQGVDWPLYVYGKLAVRDTVDRKRNYIFDRQRDDCQTVTKEDPYLTLTGPSRAAVLSVHHSYIEAELKIKDNSNDSDDKDFSYLATAYIKLGRGQSFIMKRVLPSRLSTLELTVGYIIKSVEATISVKVCSGKWPSGCGGVFTVSTASMEAWEIVLLSFGEDGLPVEGGGKQIRLSRRVVSVEVDGKLKVSGKAVLPGDSSENALRADQFFTPKKSGRSQLELKVGSCEMEVSVAWSLLLTYDC